MEVFDCFANPISKVSGPQEIELGVHCVPKELNCFNQEQKVVGKWGGQLSLKEFMHKTVGLKTG